LTPCVTAPSVSLLFGQKGEKLGVLLGGEDAANWLGFVSLSFMLDRIAPA
jgi:hypothetical protein